MAESSFSVGDVVTTSGPESRRGRVAFVGEVKFDKGTWVGVILDTRSGKNDGTVKGVEYFKTDPNKGIFVRPDALNLVRSGASSPPRGRKTSPGRAAPASSSPAKAPPKSPKGSAPKAVSPKGSPAAAKGAGGKASPKSSPAPAAKSKTFVTEVAGKAGAEEEDEEDGPEPVVDDKPSWERLDGGGKVFSWSSREAGQWLRVTAKLPKELVDPIEMKGISGPKLWEYAQMDDSERGLILSDMDIYDAKIKEAFSDALASLTAPLGKDIIASGYFDDKPGRPILLTQLMVEIEKTVKEGKFPLVFDPTGNSATFMKYFTSYAIDAKSLLMTKFRGGEYKDFLRRTVVGALKVNPTRPSSLWIDMGDSAVDLTQFFDEDTFPREIFTPGALAKEEVYLRLLRDVDDDPRKFNADPGLCVVVTSSQRDHTVVPRDLLNKCSVLFAVPDNDPTRLPPPDEFRKPKLDPFAHYLA